MSKPRTPRAPAHLSADARRWWRRIQSEYQIVDAPGLLLLTQAGEAFDRVRQCREAIDADGPVVRDRFDQLRPHPLLQAEASARGQMLACLRALDLSVEAATEHVAAVVPWRQRETRSA